ncbi:unnamed protein product, partial [Didymodactylos carnosus]
MLGLNRFFRDFAALFHRTYLLSIRKRGQTITEILLACIFLGLLLGLRYTIDRRSLSSYQLARFRPQDLMTLNKTYTNLTNVIYYYPPGTCTQAIVTAAVTKLTTSWPTFSPTVQSLSSSDIENTLSTSTQQSLYAFIYFTNVDSSCASPSSLPDQIQYTLRMQENGLFNYRAEKTVVEQANILWKYSPEYYCQDNLNESNYTTSFLGVQYFVDLAIIEYATSTAMNDLSNVHLNHFGCPSYYDDQLYSQNNFFLCIFIALIFMITFIMNLGYIVEERHNKIKQLEKDEGFTGRKYFSVFAKDEALTVKVVGFLLWVITFIDYYTTAPLGVKYFMTMFPNTSLMFIIQVMLQYERKS